MVEQYREIDMMKMVVGVVDVSGGGICKCRCVDGREVNKNELIASPFFLCNYLSPPLVPL